MRRMRSLALASAALAATFGLAPNVVAAPVKPAHRAAYNCTAGYFCLYDNWNGGGTRCQWSQKSKANTADDCSFIQRGRNVRSVWNGTGHRVQFYTQTNYHSRVGSTGAGSGGNLQGSYQIRSFRPQ
ncbi:peptidase inhibitor family I36 protein [Streptomyces sp. NPDC057743]|uniref:peptidase inhibitor family I36 protein n=1 Tax=Streptomyces sp. NPDC057743 TaxID=3346236 RepID=UPI0036BCF4A2